MKKHVILFCKLFLMCLFFVYPIFHCGDIIKNVFKSGRLGKKISGGDDHIGGGVYRRKVQTFLTLKCSLKKMI